MYHYVKNFDKSNNFNVNGLDFYEFRNQLNYLKKKYTIIGYEEFLFFTKDKKKLPKNACMLTFDDGYKEHIEYVLPELLNRKIKGLFFPSAKAVNEKKILDINYIHLIISKCSNQNDLVKDLNLLLIKNIYTKNEIDKKYKKYAIATRYDDKNVRYIKNVLQYMSNNEVKYKILKILFKKYVKLDEKKVSKSLYMSIKDIKELINNKMYVGGHGYEHLRLGLENKSLQEKEISKSLKFLKDVGAKTKDWIMCYPYGSYNAATISIIKKKIV